MRKYFKGTTGKAADGWMLAVVSGCSNIDNQDWIIDTNSLHADQVPEYCNDAQLFSKLVSGLLNCYYTNTNAVGLSEKQLADLGTVEKTEEIPSAKNPTLPF